MKKKVISLSASMVLAAIMAVPSFAAVPKDPGLDNVNVKVWKDIEKGEVYKGMGKHAEECFKEGVGLLPESGKLAKVYTKKLTVWFITGSVTNLDINGKSSTSVEDGSDYKIFNYNGVDPYENANTGKKYFRGNATIHVMTSKNKNVDLELIK